MKRLFTLSLISIMLFMFMQTTFAIAGGSFKEIRNGMGQKQVIDILGMPTDSETIIGKHGNALLYCIPIVGLIYLLIEEVEPTITILYYKNRGRVHLKTKGYKTWEIYIGNYNVLSAASKTFKIEEDPGEDGYR